MKARRDNLYIIHSKMKLLSTCFVFTTISWHDLLEGHFIRWETVRRFVSSGRAAVAAWSRRASSGADIRASPETARSQFPSSHTRNQALVWVEESWTHQVLQSNATSIAQRAGPLVFRRQFMSQATAGGQLGAAGTIRRVATVGRLTTFWWGIMRVTLLWTAKVRRD